MKQCSTIVSFDIYIYVEQVVCVVYVHVGTAESIKLKQRLPSFGVNLATISSFYTGPGKRERLEAVSMSETLGVAS